MINVLLILLFSLMTLGCTIGVQEKTVSVPKINMGPIYKDTNVLVDKRRITKKLKNIKMPRKLKMSTAEYFQLTENLFIISDFSNSKKLKNYAHNLKNQFYSNPLNTTNYSLDKSPYLSAFAGEAGGVVKAEMKDIIKSLERERIKITYILTVNFSEYFSTPIQGQGVDGILSKLERFITLFDFYMRRSKVENSIRKNIISTIRAEYSQTISELKDKSHKLTIEDNFSETVSIVKDIINSINLDVDKETTELLKSAESIGNILNNNPESVEVLQVLVTMWESMDPERRVETFGDVSSELNDYLSGASNRSRECLKTIKCKGLLRSAAKKLFILPKIKNFGVDKIAKEINDSGVEYLKGEIQEQAADFLKTVPKLVLQQIDSEFDVVKKQLVFMRDDFRGYLAESAKAWSVDYFQNSVLSAVEAESVVFSPYKNKVQVVGASASSSAVTTSEVLGSSFSLNVESWKSLGKKFKSDRHKKSFVKEYLSQLSKVLAIVGFKEKSPKQYQSLSTVSIKGQSGHSTLRKVFSMKKPFSVPDEIHIETGFVPKRKMFKKKNFMAFNQASMLMGMSQLTGYLKDWKSNEYDLALDDIKVSDILKDLPGEPLDYRVFPKDISYTVALVGAAQILMNITKENTPVLLLNSKGEYKWSNEADVVLSEKEAMAAIVDIKNGVRSTKVSAKAVAKYILAILEFLKATEGIDKTSSFLLLEEDNVTKKTAIESINEARIELKQVVIGLGNFLTHKMQGSFGGFYNSYDIEKKTIDRAKGRELSVQLICMQALIGISDYYNVDLYSWSAVDGYYFMNRKLWNNESQMYSAVEGSDFVYPKLSTLSETLKTFYKMQHQVPNERKYQWSRIKDMLELQLSRYVESVQ